MMTNLKEDFCIEDNTIQCLFYWNTTSNDTDLEKLCFDLNETIKTLSLDYIWHKDEFQISLPNIDVGKDHFNFLISSTCFGDNIEDEWFIVYLVLELTKINKNLIVQIKDEDGDFLLIESAEYLPDWVKPDVISNRVFINNGKVYIIPPPFMALNSNLNTQEAIKILIDNLQQCLPVPKVQECISKRIQNYPKNIKENNHKAIVRLPVDLAALLHIRPSLIAPIVDAYCHHDLRDAKMCKDVKYENCVYAEIIFTKCLYAMIMHSKKMFTNFKHLLHNDKKSELGLKLTCGSHLIMNNYKDMFKSKEFQTFLESLKKNGYFKENLDGSKHHNELLEKAKYFFKTVECPRNVCVQNLIQDTLSSPEFLVKKNLLAKNVSLDSNLIEDDDNWLNVNPDELNSLLNDRYGKKADLKDNDNLSSANISNELSKFIKNSSDYEGIEQHDYKSDDNQIEFDADSFFQSIQKMLNINLSTVKEEDDFSDSSDSDISCDDYLFKQISEKMEAEINCKLDGKNADCEGNVVMNNIIQSLKEEGAISGPSSNILRSIGINKTDILDSDDEL